ncbi:GTP-binding protein RAB2 [Paracoccidioides lutzii Pb01]|uniref:GTP-binding protein RAB2 n=1 Tax=Paracoccidioides lutzii (strain ATCC MYA-826 / Pb01) TaxID=502779 RepID=C1HCD9_PARBA|nr:GTP-binding protein RAB2 [Paracoccidioides lutzii Pb01]EEH38703.1 GTP-binding protein RAB2 [Paracoccidioides lutzii Pb01]
MSQPWDYIAKLVCIGDSGTGKSSLTIRLCEGRFSASHDVTIGVEFGSRIVPVGPPASDALGLDFDFSQPSPTSPSSSSSLAHIPVLPPSSTISSNSHGSTTLMNGNDPTKRKHTRTHIQTQQPAAAGLPAPPRKPRTPVVQKRMKLSLWDTAGQETYKSITRSYFRGASGALLVFDITRPATFASLTQWLQDLRQIAEEGIVVVLVGNKSDLAASEAVDGNNCSSDQQQQQPYNTIVTREEAEAWCRTNNVSRYVETSAKSGEGVERAFLEVAERIYRNIEAGRYDLNDRRSGVKGFGATGGAGGGPRRVQRTVTLGVNDAMERRGNGCC